MTLNLQPATTLHPRAVKIGFTADRTIGEVASYLEELISNDTIGSDWRVVDVRQRAPESSFDPGAFHILVVPQEAPQ